VPGQWSIQLTGDFNGDSLNDILWRDTWGNVAIWENRDVEREQLVPREPQGVQPVSLCLDEITSS
jgi:hypothetical protein